MVGSHYCSLVYGDLGRELQVAERYGGDYTKFTAE